MKDLAKYEVKNKSKDDLLIEFTEEVCINFDLDGLELRKCLKKNQRSFVRIASRFPINSACIIKINYLECLQELSADDLSIGILIAKDINASSIWFDEVHCGSLSCSKMFGKYAFLGGIDGKPAFIYGGRDNPKQNIERMNIHCDEWRGYIKLPVLGYYFDCNKPYYLE